jgi:hypothetical protein
MFYNIVFLLMLFTDSSNWNNACYSIPTHNSFSPAFIWAYSKKELDNNGNTASSCFKPFQTWYAWDRCLTTEILFRILVMHISISMIKFLYIWNLMLITVAVRSKAWNVFTRSNTRVMGSNPARGMDVGVCLLCVCDVLLCLWTAHMLRTHCPVQGVLPT